MKRVWSIARLTFREAVHNKVLLSGGLFAGALVLVRVAVFAVGEPERWVTVERFTRVALFLVLSTAAVVTIVVVSPSLSQDIRSKVIYTVIPKPVHRVEMLLGKVLGFTATVGLLVAVMGGATLGLLYLTEGGRAGQANRRLLAAEVRTPATGIRFAGGWLNYMKRSDRRWINPEMIETEEDRKEREVLGTAPLVPGEAIFTFDNIRPQDLRGQPLRFELKMGVYRFGGAAEKAPPEVSVQFDNRRGQRQIVGRLGLADTERTPFLIKEDTPHVLEVPNSASFLGDGATVDVIVRNLTYKLRIGLRRTDAALLLGDRSYAVNFLKGLLILFLELLVVVVIAVMSSTFLSGPVAILFTAVAWAGGHILGYMGEVIREMSRAGRGPLVDVAKEFGRPEFAPYGPFDWVIQFANTVFTWVLTVAVGLFPNLSRFDGVWLVPRNVDISASTVWQAAVFSVVYSAICLVIAYTAFRVKEVAK